MVWCREKWIIGKMSMRWSMYLIWMLLFNMLLNGILRLVLKFVSMLEFVSFLNMRYFDNVVVEYMSM